MRICSLFAFAGASAALAAMAACAPSGDDSPPRIVEGPTVSVVRDKTATIAWITNELANGGVEYGPDTNYGTVEIDNLFLESHVVTIRNLTPETNYHLRVLSYDVFGNGPTRSEDILITTLPLQPPPDIVINEVMANPNDQFNDEYIELYNNGGEDFDLTGFTIDDLQAVDTLKSFDGGSTVLSPGEFAVILDAGYGGTTYDIPAGTVLLTTNDSTLGGFGLGNEDPILLYAPGESEPISTFGTPLDPSDNFPAAAPSNTSWERVDPSASDSPANWCTSAVGGTPGAPSGC